MNDFLIIQDVVVILSVSLPIIFLFKKINLPSIVGFLIAGMLIGPYGFNLIKSVNQISVMAEIGIMLLMFTIGLEFSLSQLIKIKKFLLIAGGFQLLLTIIFSTIIFSALGLELKQSIFFSLLVSLSSTAIVLKILSDKNELEAPHGKFSIGILIFQDLAIVPMFLLLPLLSGFGKLSGGDIALNIAITFGVLAGLFLLARFLMPLIVYQIANIRMREAFTIGVILLLLGTAYITHTAGLSFALGAFIAGLILSESEYNHQIVSDILPFRDAFNSIFFVSIGLLLNINFVLDNVLMISSLTLGILLVKTIVVVIIIYFMKYPLRVAVLAGLGLAQIGEFSFVLAQAGLNFNLFATDFYYNGFLASTIFSMILTPLLIKLSPFIAGKTSAIEKNKKHSENYLENLHGHVIIAGFGLNGSNLARVLKETGIKYIVTELNPDTVKKEKAKGEKIIYGDISKDEVLNAVKIDKASIIVYAISDPAVTRRSLTLVKKINPQIYALVRTRYVNEVDELIKLGADDVIPEEFETALQIFRKVLERFHIPLNVIMQQTTLLREESYRFLRKEGVDISAFSHLDEILAQGLTETYYVNNQNPHINKNLAEINLRAKTDATIIAIVRNGKTISNPSAKEMILTADTLVIYGTHLSVDKAINVLNKTEQE
ncbi:MAG: cation:proton antiporter [Ignavibacteriaceae bacterium]|nr:cation:proton antiporter [Ignavibacterium sp.]MCC6254120.1 cation:proton antiporter [Ignavibacteriaceae bacterium]HMN23078.1 cation:proton antiporter [Ignavibacteriaceae bacterium]HRN26702.1 cation:proton antiporter [Ignavibacteriaceae bacterium]HRP91328.1 cation:proton antiporter [Ignavibacteriaceae bacterium]